LFNFLFDLEVAALLVPCDVGVHLVDANNELLDSKQVDQVRVLPEKVRI
jgi:hypothetical protein